MRKDKNISKDRIEEYLAWIESLKTLKANIGRSLAELLTAPIKNPLDFQGIARKILQESSVDEEE